MTEDTLHSHQVVCNVDDYATSKRSLNVAYFIDFLSKLCTKELCDRVEKDFYVEQENVIYRNIITNYKIYFINIKTGLKLVFENCTAFRDIIVRHIKCAMNSFRCSVHTVLCTIPNVIIESLTILCTLHNFYKLWVPYIMELPFVLISKCVGITIEYLQCLNDIIVCTIPRSLCQCYCSMHLYTYTPAQRLLDTIHRWYACLLTTSLADVATAATYIIQFAGSNILAYFIHIKLSFALFPSLMYPIHSSLVHFVAMISYSLTTHSGEGNEAGFKTHFDNQTSCKYSITKAYTPIDLISVVGPTLIAPIFSISNIFNVLLNVSCSAFKLLFLPDLSSIFPIINYNLTAYILPIDFISMSNELLSDGQIEKHSVAILNFALSFVPKMPVIYPDVVHTVYVNLLCRSLEDILYIFHPWPRIPIRNEFTPVYYCS